MLDRRTFRAGTGAVLLAAPLVAEAQQPGKVYRIGVMIGPPFPLPRTSSTHSGRGSANWAGSRGKNIEREIRTAEGNTERCSAFTAELVRLKVDIIVASVPAADAARLPPLETKR